MYSNKYLVPEWRTAEKKPIRDGVGEGLERIGSDERVVVLTANLGGSTRAKRFADKWPERYFDVGVAEQNLAGVAAGMALEGRIPFMASFAAFSPGRNWEQIRVSIALSKANVKIIGSHGGVATGENGPSHQATEDLALMRVLPNMTVFVPADATQAAAAIEAAYQIEGPVYIRTARPEVPNFTKPISFERGKVYKYREGKDVTVAACGIQVWDALMVAEELAKEGMECEVLNVSSIKPLDELAIVGSAAKTQRVVTIEDHQMSGGLGSAVAELLSEEMPVPIRRLGSHDSFGKSGPWQEYYQQVGLDRESITLEIRKFVLD